MKILVVCQYFWPEPFRIMDVCQGLREKGHEVTVLTGIPNYPEGKFYKGYGVFGPHKEIHQGIRIIRIPLIPRRKGKGIQLMLNYISFAFMATILAPFACRGKYDLIFTYQLSPVTMALPAVFLKRLKKAPLIHYVLDLWPESMAAAGGTGEGRTYGLMGKVVTYIYKRCDLILASSRGFIPKIHSRGAKPEKVKYWPQWAEEIFSRNTTDNTASDAVAINRSCEIKPADFKIVFAGNIGEAQGFSTLLEAAELLKNRGNRHIHWIILGDGRLKPWVEQEVEKRSLGNVFHLLGRKPVEEMPDYYAFADALLVSLKNEELFSLTLPAKVQSYLASGKPVIAAMNGEGARIVEDADAGLACPGENAEELAKIIEEMSRLPEAELLNLGRKGREYFDRNFSRRILLEQLDEYISELSNIKN